MGIQEQAELYLDATVPHDLVAAVGAPAMSVRCPARYVAQKVTPEANLVASRVGKRARKQLHYHTSMLVVISITVDVVCSHGTS
jgi:hypothetical protein